MTAPAAVRVISRNGIPARRLPLAEIHRQTVATATRPPWTLPASWWDQDAAEQMARYVAAHTRTTHN